MGRGTPQEKIGTVQPEEKAQQNQENAKETGKGKKKLKYRMEKGRINLLPRTKAPWTESTRRVLEPRESSAASQAQCRETHFPERCR